MAALLRQWPDVTLEILKTPDLPAPRQRDDPPQVNRRLRRYDGPHEALAALRRHQTDADRADDVLVLDVVREGVAQGNMRCGRILAQVG